MKSPIWLVERVLKQKLLCLVLLHTYSAILGISSFVRRPAITVLLTCVSGETSSLGIFAQ